MCADDYIVTWSSGEATCGSCSQAGSHTLPIIVGSIIVVGAAAIAFVCHKSGLAKQVKKVYRVGSVKLRLLFFAAQVISSFVSISSETGDKKKLPEPATTVAAALGATNLDLLSFISLRCLLPATDFYTTLLFKTTSPFALIVLLFLFPLVLQIVRKKPGGEGESRKAWWHTSAQYSLILLELVLPSTATTIGYTLACGAFLQTPCGGGGSISYRYNAIHRQVRRWVASASRFITGVRWFTAPHSLGDLRIDYGRDIPNRRVNVVVLCAAMARA